MSKLLHLMQPRTVTSPCKCRVDVASIYHEYAVFGFIIISSAYVAMEVVKAFIDDITD